MKKNLLLATLAVLAFLAACTGNRHHQKTPPPPDKVVVKADTMRRKETIKRIDLVYQAAATHVNDLLHTKLDVSFDYSKCWMYGKATISSKAYFHPVDHLNLDARGMTIKRVAMITTSADMGAVNPKKTPGGAQVLPKAKSDTTDLKYDYKDDVLSIALGRSYTRDETYTVYIDYISKPNELKSPGGSAAINEDRGLYFINPDGKDPEKPTQIWTQGETQSNSVWMPTIDRPNEKMTSEIYMTVESKYVTLSNGAMVESISHADGTRTDHWKMDLPSATYLVMMAVGDFAIVKDKWRDKEVNYYVEPKYAQYAKMTFGKTPAMIEYFSKTLGVDYPWNKYSQICVRDYVSGAMENTTATLHSDYLQQTDREMLDRDYEDYISHELFHQWFGDLVTCESWSNLPLNESMADFSEHLWIEHDAGLDEADHHRLTSMNGYFREAVQKKEPLIRYYYNDREDMFDRHSYNKGGCVLHMLRKYVGDEAFFASLKLYLETNKFKNAEIANLRLAFEQVTGEDLNWFFNQWFLAPGHPVLDITYAYDSTAHKEKVTVKQIQDRSKPVSLSGQIVPLFKIPMSVDVYTGGNASRQQITVTKTEETFSFDCAAKPDLINVDAEKMLLAEKIDHHSTAEWAYMYRHAPLYIDRVEALNGLSPKEITDSINALPVFVEALGDKDWSLRQLAISRLGKFAAQQQTILVRLAQGDAKAAVRAEAIKALSKNSNDAMLVDLYKRMLNDRSYHVISESLDALTSHAPDYALTLAPSYSHETSNEILSSVCRIYSKTGPASNDSIFRRLIPKIEGVDQYFAVSYYSSFLQRIDDDALTTAALPFLHQLAKDEDGGLKEVVRHVLSSLSEFYGKKSTDLQNKINDLSATDPNATGLPALRDKLAAAKAMQARVMLEKSNLDR